MSSYIVTINNVKYEVSKAELDDLDIVERNHQFHIIHKNHSHISKCLSINGKELRIVVDGVEYDVEIMDEVDQMVAKLGMDQLSQAVIRDIKAPMPGLILDILVKPGQDIKAGDPLLILEAMKMENVIKAPADSTVKELNKKKGDSVDKGEILISML